MTSVGVIVPAKDEARLLPRCLTALAEARVRLRLVDPSVVVHVLVVLDSCRDDSAEIVAAHPSVNALAVQASCVGVARQRGLLHLLDVVPGIDWFANTDADSAVPPEWLTTQLGAARAGTDLLLGSVRPAPEDLTEVELAGWRARHDLGDGHQHVFGANLGFNRRTLARTGGFRPLPVHEDVDLTRRARASGLVVQSTGASPVVTSARRVGRTPSGFAAYVARELISDA